MRWLFFTLAVLATGPAYALSCMKLTPQSLYTWAHEAEEIYVPVHGTFSHEEFVNPNKDSNNLKRLGYQIAGQFTGRLITRNGFGPVLDTYITINVTCVASWCGGAPGTDTALAVLERRDEAFILHKHACPTNVIYNPSDRDMRAFRTCLSTKSCNPF